MGRPQKKHFVTTVVDRDLYRKVQRVAKSEQRTVAAVIRLLLMRLPDPGHPPETPASGEVAGT